jgi:putative membrane protein
MNTDAIPGWIHQLPHLQAMLNGTALISLLAGYAAIRKQARTIHQRHMMVAVLMSALFLVAYLVYHSFVGRTVFAGGGLVRVLFFSILISHIAGSVLLVPMLFATLRHAIQQRFEAHRPLARKTLALWIYVSITGLVVYGMGNLIR